MNTLTERLTKLLKSDLSKQCSSAAYAVLIDGEITAEDSMGRNPIRGGTYNVGSVSKVYCTTAVMQLVEKGLLELDRPVCEYLPKFHMPDSRFRQITLRHCLNHSSGLPGTQWRWLAAGRPRREDYYDEVYDMLSHCALHSAPGEYSVYCNDGFTLAEMAIAEVTGLSYGEYCKKYITEPIGAHSSRQSSQRNPEYSHTSIVGMPEESIGPEGAGGIGTTMNDLCKFGALFLNRNQVLSEESKQEIIKPQGSTFLPHDGWSPNYGLGWDSVDMPHEEYDLGSGVLDKGGGTKEFSSRLLVIPKYHAVLAISATYDCGVDVKAEILQLFAVAMLERGVNIWKACTPVSVEDKEKYSGLYLASGKFYQVSMEGPRADILSVNSRGGSQMLYQNLLHNCGRFSWKPHYSFYFEEYDGKCYLMAEVQNHGFALGIKAADCRFDALPEAWNRRIGKDYIIANVFSDDIIGNSELNSFRLNLLPDVPNGLTASFTSTGEDGQVSCFEIPLTPYVNGEPSKQLACGALHLPYHSGRDLLNLYFKEINGKEVCECSGYLYVAAADLEAYSGQSFENQQQNQVYVIEKKLESLPFIPEGHRILVFNDKFAVVYDSLLNETYTPQEKGYLSLI